MCQRSCGLCSDATTDSPAVETVTYHQDQENFCQEFTFVADDCMMLKQVIDLDSSFVEGPCTMTTTCPPEFDSLAEEAMTCLEYSYFCQISYIIADQTSCME